MKKNLLAAQRRKQLTEMVNQNGSVRIGEIATLFGVSSETIRKDLIYLHNCGAVQKSFGGALALSEHRERSVQKRSMEHTEKKALVAQCAVENFVQGGVIFLDSGSTVLEVAKLLRQDMDIAVVTNSLAALNELSGKGIDIHFVGGVFSDVTMATSGFWATNAVCTIQFDVAFLGTSGFRSHDGPSVKTFDDAQVKQEVMKNARKKIVLADSSKFQENALVQYAHWQEIDVLIADSSVSKDAVARIKQSTQVLY